MNITIKINDKTRKKLKLLAGLLDKTMIDVLDELIEEKLKQIQADEPAKSL
jgi:predicted transcriptional regulator